MRKKSASGVLARHSRLTGSAAFTNVPRVIPRGVNLRGSPYRKSTIRPFVCCGLAGRHVELSVRHDARSEFFRNLLGHAASVEVRDEVGERPD